MSVSIPGDIPHITDVSEFYLIKCTTFVEKYEEGISSRIDFLKQLPKSTFPETFGYENPFVGPNSLHFTPRRAYYRQYDHPFIKFAFLGASDAFLTESTSFVKSGRIAGFVTMTKGIRKRVTNYHTKTPIPIPVCVFLPDGGAQVTAYTNKKTAIETFTREELNDIMHRDPRSMVRMSEGMLTSWKSRFQTQKKVLEKDILQGFEGLQKVVYDMCLPALVDIKLGKSIKEFPYFSRTIPSMLRLNSQEKNPKF